MAATANDGCRFCLLPLLFVFGLLSTAGLVNAAEIVYQAGGRIWPVLTYERLWRPRQDTSEADSSSGNYDTINGSRRLRETPSYQNVERNGAESWEEIWIVNGGF